MEEVDEKYMVNIQNTDYWYICYVLVHANIKRTPNQATQIHSDVQYSSNVQIDRCYCSNRYNFKKQILVALIIFKSLPSCVLF